jgi:hypothetical protein
MRITSLICAALVLSAAGCGANGVADPPSTGLTGTVVRGPIMPVCQVQVPCDAPFSADFNVQAQGRVVAAFSSDSLGHFEVHLQPGAYLIVPGPDAPIMSPSSQAKPVTVGPVGLTTVQLEFDTGIR